MAKRLITRSIFAAMVLALAGGVASAQEAAAPVTLKVGDAAPQLKVAKWVQGQPVTKFEPGTVYVIECWATWCGPCIAAIPHVNELQKKYEGKVVVIGMNIWEDNEAGVEPFVKKMGDKMTYRVAMDDKSTDSQGAVATNWMKAAGKNGIPCSFIIDKEGKIAWIGHPMSMDTPLEQIVAGTFDPKAAVATEEKMTTLNKRLTAAMEAGNIDEAIKILDEAGEANAAVKNQIPLIKFNILIQSKKYEKAYALGDSIYNVVKDDAQRLNQLAWMMTTEDSIETRDLKLAKRFAERAVEVSERKDGAILDTLARIHFDMGEIDKAIEVQTEAVKAADAEGKKELEETLEKYKKAKK